MFQKGFWYVLYFLFLTVFVGFFLLNMLVGIMATMTQPKTQELFEKEHILRQRVNKAAVSQLKQQIETVGGLIYGVGSTRAARRCRRRTRSRT